MKSKTRKALRVFLKYTPDKRSRDHRPEAHLAARQPPLSRRQRDIAAVVGGMGISILTTPRGVMTGRAARRERIGGELLCEVW